MDKGCFVQFHNFRGKEGLVHVSQMETRRISNAKDIVKRDQEVFLKVISVSGNNVSLSMRDVDQNSGKDLLPLKRSETDDGMMAKPLGRNDGGGMGSRIGLSGIRITEEVDAVPSRRPLKKMSSPERWEAKNIGCTYKYWLHL
ncbi:RNA helicase [Salvia divinorum]|uniref:RNA helicase n=1 Tax=Salvia divinorum TaxID=28513 RepID=A0ABD1FH49_SALDI